MQNFQVIMPQDIIRWFQETRDKPTKVNGKEYPNVEGTPTPGGFYENGFKARQGDIYDTNYLSIQIYTSAAHQIDIEETIILKREPDEEFYSIYSWRGWNNVDLLKMRGGETEWFNMLRAIYQKYNQ
jgi:hypothetical protein